MLRPTLVIETVYLHDDEREAAVDLGDSLYAHLTRPPDDPLAYGAGIPVLSGVAADCVDPEAADVVVLVPVLGKASFHTSRKKVLEKLAAWHETLGKGHVIPVPVAEVWRNAEEEMPGKLLLTAIYGGQDAERSTLDEIVLAVARLLDDGPGQDRLGVQLFISHAKRDLEPTGDAARLIQHQLVTKSTGKAFFDATDLHPGRSLAEQIEQAGSRGVLVAVRGDAYSSRAWCQQELLTAKRHELPTLTVEVLKEGEQRASPYGGNAPSITWRNDPGAVASRAMVEWLRAAYFEREGERVKAAARLPADTRTLSRPPELLDLAQGPLERGKAQLVLYPDPELSVQERRVLRNAHPRLQLATPTTAFRRLLGRDGRGAVATPLEGMQVAMSLSDNPDAGGPEGYTANHFRDATVYLARSLISAGAAIAYGGDFRPWGFTRLLSELIASYNQTALERADYLHSYLAAGENFKDAPDEPMTLHFLGDGGDLEAKALIRRDANAPGALYYSDMRRLLALEVSACVAIGGVTEPKATDDGAGYGGAYPGILEECWRMLEAGKPLYVLGGLGGAAALVAELLRGSERIPDRLCDETWSERERYREISAKIGADPHREQLGLPLRMRDMAERVRELGTGFLKSDESSVEWNGLSIEENRQLFRSRDPVIQASLVLKGLLNRSRERGEGKLEVELNLGSVTQASDLDVIALATFEQVPLGGAGAALDRVLGGRASTSRMRGQSLISLSAPNVDANWLHLASLGPLSGETRVIESAEQAARETVREARRHGFSRIGVVTFGGSIASPGEVAEAMLRGFGDLAGRATLVWFETNSDRFKELRETLAKQDGVTLSTCKLLGEQAGATATAREPLLLHVTYDGKRLSSTIVPPAGTGIAKSSDRELDAAALKRLVRGSGPKGRQTPRMEMLVERGQELASLLFGDDAANILGRSREAGIVVIHDVKASGLPFEILGTDAMRPATEGGVKRRLAIPGVPVGSLFAPAPGTGKLAVALIVNPTRDLPGTVAEADAVRAALANHGDRIDLTVLGDGGEKEATCEAVLATLQTADVLHYCGHAFFDGPGEEESGLLLSDRKLTLRGIRELATVPRVVFFNACEAGRVRGKFTNEAAAFAELILRSGVEAYLGTYWEVGDAAAASFATGVYTRLADGTDLDTAVTESRADLYEARQPDWANYLLYGDGRFRLSRPR